MLDQMNHIIHLVFVDGDDSLFVANVSTDCGNQGHALDGGVAVLPGSKHLSATSILSPNGYEHFLLFQGISGSVNLIHRIWGDPPGGADFEQCAEFTNLTGALISARANATFGAPFASTASSVGFDVTESGGIVESGISLSPYQAFLATFFDPNAPPGENLIYV